MAQSSVVDSLIKQGERLNRQFVTGGDSVITRRIAVENVKIKPQTTIVTSIAVNDDYFYLSSPTFMLPQSMLDGTYLLSDGAAHLGAETIQRVVNNNNTYLDYLYHNTLWSGDLTLDTSTFKITIDEGEEALLGPVYKDSGTVTAATISLDYSSERNTLGNGDFGTFPLSFPIALGGDAEFYLSADGATTWEQVAPGSKHTFTTTGTELWAKIVSTVDGSFYQVSDSTGKHIPIKITYEVS